MAAEEGRLTRLFLSTSEGVFALPAEAMDLPDYVNCAQVSPAGHRVPTDQNR